MIVEATDEQIESFKMHRVVSTRDTSGNAYNAQGFYDEIANICGQEVHIKCSISEQDVDLYRFAS